MKVAGTVPSALPPLLVKLMTSPSLTPIPSPEMPETVVTKPALLPLMKTKLPMVVELQVSVSVFATATVAAPPKHSPLAQHRRASQRQ